MKGSRSQRLRYDIFLQQSISTLRAKVSAVPVIVGHVEPIVL
jgi:hypothetical protein